MRLPYPLCLAIIAAAGAIGGILMGLALAILDPDWYA